MRSSSAVRSLTRSSAFVARGLGRLELALRALLGLLGLGVGLGLRTLGREPLEVGLPPLGPRQEEHARLVEDAERDDTRHPLAEGVVGVEHLPHRGHGTGRHLLELQERLQRLRRSGGVFDRDDERCLERVSDQLVRDHAESAISSVVRTCTAPAGPHHRHVTDSMRSSSTCSSSIVSSPATVKWWNALVRRLVTTSNRVRFPQAVQR